MVTLESRLRSKRRTLDSLPDLPTLQQLRARLEVEIEELRKALAFPREIR